VFALVCTELGNNIHLLCSGCIYVGLTEAGFPLCSFLVERGCQIGRNARMLACHSPPRVASSKNVSMHFHNNNNYYYIDIRIKIT